MYDSVDLISVEKLLSATFLMYPWIMHEQWVRASCGVLTEYVREAGQPAIVFYKKEEPYSPLVSTKMFLMVKIWCVFFFLYNYVSLISRHSKHEIKTEPRTTHQSSITLHSIHHSRLSGNVWRHCTQSLSIACLFIYLPVWCWWSLSLSITCGEESPSQSTIMQP